MNMNWKMATGKDTYPSVRWAIFHVSSSLTVQGSLNPKYLLKGILGAKFPVIMINKEMSPTTSTSLFSMKESRSFGDKTVMREIKVTIKIEILLIVRMVFIFGLSSDRLAIWGAFISKTIKAIRIKAPIMVTTVLLSVTKRPRSKMLIETSKKKMRINDGFFPKILSS